MTYHENLSGLLLEELKKGNDVVFKVSSNSMRPLIITGDHLTVRRYTLHKLKRGDVILVVRESDYLTHRFIEQNDGVIVLKGDRLINFDPPIKIDCVLGKVISITRGKRQISLTSFYATIINRIQGLLGFAQGNIYRNLEISINENDHIIFFLWSNAMKALAKSIYIPIVILDFITL
ncbi:MAG TPA: S26 family signal peptidase [Anaerolineae bacterium]|nr:S26 family signal peptidase [Anaerolineae bacterium]